MLSIYHHIRKVFSRSQIVIKKISPKVKVALTVNIIVKDEVMKSQNFLFRKSRTKPGVVSLPNTHCDHTTTTLRPYHDHTSTTP